MKKIVHIFNSIEYSGAERMVYSLKDFYCIEYIPYAISTGESKGDFFDEFSNYFRTYHIPIAYRRNYEYLCNFFSMIFFYRKEKIDVVHIHPSRRFLFHVIAAKLGGVKLIVRQVHNNFYFTRFVKFKEMIGRKLAIKLGTVIVSISESVYNNELERFKIKSILVKNFFNESKIFPCELNQRKLLREKIGIPANAFCIISVGSCIERKQHDHILNMIYHLNELIDNVYYLHLGNGPLCDKEKELAKRLKLCNKVNFLGNQDNMRDYLAVSDLYVMTSKIEGLSISTIEAMGTKLPVVLYDSPGLKELGTKSAPGIIVKCDVTSLCEKVYELFLHPELRLSTAQKCFDYSMKNYTKEAAIQNWKNVYKHA